MFILDIGGEGRHPDAWNLNPRKTKTLGPDRGLPIPCPQEVDRPEGAFFRVESEPFDRNWLRPGWFWASWRMQRGQAILWRL